MANEPQLELTADVSDKVADVPRDGDRHDGLEHQADNDGREEKGRIEGQPEQFHAGPDCQHQTTFGLAHLGRRREERDDHRQPEQLEHARDEQPRYHEHPGLDGDQPQNPCKSVQPDGWFPPPLREHTNPALQHAIDAFRRRRLSWASALVPHGRTLRQPAARDRRAEACPHARKRSAQARKFAQEQWSHAGVTYRTRDVIEAPSAESIQDGGRLRSLSVASWDPGPIPLRSMPGSSRKAGSRPLLHSGRARVAAPGRHSRAPRPPLTRRRRAALEPSHDTQRSVKGSSGRPRVPVASGPLGRSRPCRCRRGSAQSARARYAAPGSNRTPAAMNPPSTARTWPVM